MMDNNGNNGGYRPYNGQQPYVNNEQNHFNDPRYYNNNSGGYTGEYSYTPQRQSGNTGRKILTSVLAVFSITAIAVTSIIGYRLVVGKDDLMPADRQDNSVVTVPDAETGTQTAERAVVRGDLPTLQQLAAPADALTVPEIIEKMSPSVVGISCITNQGIATGSGIILSEDGYIITNAHVIKDAQSISVVLPPVYGSETDTQDDLTYTAENVGKDTQTDLAVLKIERTDLRKAEIGTSADVRVGELAIVIGNPLGLDLANTATSGIISAKDRTITVEDITMKVMQTDASINGGNSGGALINAYGQVIGITSAKVASAQVEGLGFAIPIDDALPIVKDLMAYGYVTGRPSLGITGTDITAAYSSYYGIPQGFLVRTITTGGGADRAGLKENDIIIAINDNIVNGIVQLNNVKNTFKPGDTVTLTVYRDRKKLDIDVVLDEATGETAQTDTNNNNNNNNNGNGYNDYNYYYDPFSFFGGF
ncbi:S1C family serine protease [uncultured Ruminococcus sp.]|uniref:S1C family serine protease n=1 Tax=uncultured Ruminococcus sp. TaxID=165186 RepID=UPI0025D3C2EB|nr:trypsin-like peptidase domain-containing protein [uncultured Ruminococcus sp.]